MTYKINYKKIFKKELIKRVWEKGDAIDGLDPNVYRKDICGAIIKIELYDNQANPLFMGWAIDYIKPLDIGGEDVLANLQPLHYKNNKHKSTHYPLWNCYVTSINNKNIIMNNL
jgi:hypothetical protein